MFYIYMDGSGCLGFTRGKGSQYFIIAGVVTTKKRLVEQIVKKTFDLMPPRMRQEHYGVLHCYKMMPKYRRRLLRLLTEISGVMIIAIRIEKKAISA